MTLRQPTLLHVFSTFKVGGPQVRFVQIANHFGRKYRHLIISMDGSAEARARLSPEVDATLMSFPNHRGGFLTNVVACRHKLRELAPDVLITSNWGTIEWALANFGRRTPHLHMEDGFGQEEANRQIARRIWMRRLALRGSTVVLPSIALLSMARNVWRLPTAHLLHIPNGVDCQRFKLVSDPAFLARFGIRNELPVIGTVTGLRPEKNLYRLIDAFAGVLEARPAQLVIVGDGPERAGLEAHAVSRGVGTRVVFAGAQSEPEKFLAHFSVFALSSDTEQMPLSVLEAMAAGLPVVATDVGDIRFMVTEGNARFVVKPGVNALTQALLTLLDNEAMAVALGLANAQRAATVFGQDGMFAAYGDLFDGVWPAERPQTRDVNHETASNYIK